MKKLFLILLTIAIFVSCKNSKKIDYELIPVKYQGKWGLINHKGDFVISPQFDDLSYNYYRGVFTDGLLIYKNSDGKFGYINNLGKIIINAKYNNASPFVNGYALVSEKNQYLKFINTKGEVIKELIDIEIAYQFCDGLAHIQKNDKSGFIDTKGNIVINPIFSDAINFYNGIAAVSEYDKKNNDFKWGLIDKNGKYINDIRYDRIFSFSNNGLAKAKDGKLWGYIDITGKYIINPQYEECEGFSDGLAKIKKDDKYGFINKNNEIVIPAQFVNARDFNNGYTIVEIENEKFGIIDKSGKYIIQPIYKGLSNFYNDIAFFMKDSLWGIIDKKQNIIVQPKFQSINNYSENTTYGFFSEHNDYNAIIKKILNNSDLDQFRGISKFNTFYDIKNNNISIDDSYIDGDYTLIDSKPIYLGDGAKISTSKYIFNYPINNTETEKYNTITSAFYTINTNYTADIYKLADDLIKILSNYYHIDNIKEINPASVKLEDSWSIKFLESNNYNFILFYRFDFPPNLTINVRYNNSVQ